jgi:hypothetical protein
MLVDVARMTRFREAVTSGRVVQVRATPLCRRISRDLWAGETWAVFVGL